MTDREKLIELISDFVVHVPHEEGQTWEEACADHLLANCVTVQQTEPLTLDELRNMGGEPVYIEDWYENFFGWELSVDAGDYFEGESRTESSYGSRWVAYRNKPPKEG